MNKILLVALCSLTLLSCEKDRPANNLSSDGRDADNTERNVRDRNSATKTPFDQSESEADRTLTQKIRQALINDSSLSTNAKNIKIISINGIVTLRGPVAALEEKESIARKVRQIQGVERIDNQLEITRSSSY